MRYNDIYNIRHVVQRNAFGNLVKNMYLVKLPSSEDLNDNKSMLVQVMGLVTLDNKPLPVPMFTHISVII